MRRVNFGFWEDVQAWLDAELTKLNANPAEREILRHEFSERERGKWNLRSWREHMVTRLSEIRAAK